MAASPADASRRRQENRRQLDARRSKCRIRLGGHMEQWCLLKERLGFSLHSQLAKFLLDRYTSSGSVLCAGLECEHEERTQEARSPRGVGPPPESFLPPRKEGEEEDANEEEVLSDVSPWTYSSSPDGPGSRALSAVPLALEEDSEHIGPKRIRRAARRELLPCDFPGCGRIFSNRQYLNVRALTARTLGPWRRRGCG